MPIVDRKRRRRFRCAVLKTGRKSIAPTRYACKIVCAAYNTAGRGAARARAARRRGVDAAVEARVQCGGARLLLGRGAGRIGRKRAVQCRQRRVYLRCCKALRWHCYHIAELAAPSVKVMSALPALMLEAKQLLQLLPQVDHLEELIATVMRDIFDAPSTAEDLVRLRRLTSMDSKSLGSVFTGLHWLLRACMRSGLKAKALSAELEELSVDPSHIQSIIAAVEDGCVMPCPILLAKQLLP
eukprot:6214110-Pleurochrysis_carterae.AAC.4